MLCTWPFPLPLQRSSPSTACVSRFGEPIAADGIWLRPQPIGPEPRSRIRVAVPLQETFWPLGLRGLCRIHLWVASSWAAAAEMGEACAR